MLDRDQIVSISASKAGLKFAVEKGKTLHVKAYIKTDVFSEYVRHISDENEVITFHIYLNIFLQVLQIFDSETTHLQMSYPGPGAPLSIILEDSGVITRCEINTIDFESASDLTLANSSVIGEMYLPKPNKTID
jgi:cell cycle checkpoint protein